MGNEGSHQPDPHQPPSALKVGDKVELMDSTHPRNGQTGSVKYFSGWNPAVIWDVDGSIDISHKADNFQILNN